MTRTLRRGAAAATLCGVLALGNCTAWPGDAARHPADLARAAGLFDRSPIQQPYAYLHDGSFCGPAVPESPDPLVAFRWANPQPSDALQVYLLRPQAVVADPSEAFANLASLTGESPDVAVNGVGSIRLDFGVECAAWIEFDSLDCTGEVEMSLSEYSEPGIGKTRTPVRHGNTWRLELNDELYDGVRFAWIHVRSWQGPWHITGVRAVCQVKPTHYLGSFACSDPLLTRSWYMAAYGVKVALCKDYFGAILMERGDRMSWTGDAHPAQAAALVAFGNREFVRQNLANTARQDNGIRSYALYWVLSLLDYYRYSGDADTLTLYLDNAAAKLDDANAVWGTDPPLRFYGWDERLGAGFEIWFRPSAEPQRAYQMLSIRAWREFAAAMAQLGRSDLRDRYAGLASERLAALARDRDWYASFGLHAAADAINTGLLDQATGEALYEKEFNDRTNRLSLSPFNQLFILQAMARLGRWDDALCTVRDMWGGMLDYGGTTPFEVYRPSWNRILSRNDAVPNAQCGIVSLCHPWGAGVVPWLSEQVLGIVPTTPGFATYDIRPHLGSTLTWVAGATPTPGGEIRASFDLDTGAGLVSAPAGTLGRLCVPKAGRRIARIAINGVLAWDGRGHPVPGLAAASEDAEFVLFEGLAPGDYAIATTYRGKATTPAPAALVQAGQLPRHDQTTSGDWGGVYGRDGHVLCSYGAGGTDRQSLPPYVRSLDFFRAFPKAGRPDSTTWAATTDDRRALAPDAANTTPRTAAATSNNDQTMTVTIQVEAGSRYQVALYFVDWEHRGQRTAVEMFDADTLRLLAPVSLVRGHDGGEYLVYECDRSVKFRFDKVRGELVTLSGIFFDPAPR